MYKKLKDKVKKAYNTRSATKNAPSTSKRPPSKQVEKSREELRLRKQRLAVAAKQVQNAELERRANAARMEAANSKKANREAEKLEKARRKARGTHTRIRTLGSRPRPVRPSK